MITIKTRDGQDVNLNESAIVLIAGSYPHDVGPHTYIYDIAHRLLVTAEGSAVRSVEAPF
jgi:hypothetical protein